MDPNAALRALRELSRSALEDADGFDSSDFSTTMCALAENFQALDEWISKGGFLPEGWKSK